MTSDSFRLLVAARGGFGLLSGDLPPPVALLDRWSTWLGRQFTRAPLGSEPDPGLTRSWRVGPSGRLFAISGQLAVLAFLVTVRWFFSAVRLGNKIGMDQRAPPAGQRVWSICLSSMPLRWQSILLVLPRFVVASFFITIPNYGPSFIFLYYNFYYTSRYTLYSYT